ncbi:hypothetical protein pb186bvf_009257 [Paramecium bursaria]
MKKKQPQLHQYVVDIKNSGRVIKYLQNSKSESCLDKPVFKSTISQLSKEKLQELKRQLYNQEPDKLEFTVFDPIPVPKVPLKVQQLLQKTGLKQKVQLNRKQRVRFPQEGTTDGYVHKKSKFETLIYRLKEQMHGEELNLKQALIALTPQYEHYKQQRQQILVFDIIIQNDMKNYSPDLSASKVIDKTIERLGLKSINEKKEQRHQYVRSELTVQTVQTLKSERLDTKETDISLQALQAQSKLFSQILKTQQEHGQYRYPFEVKQLMKIKHKVKGFYDGLLVYQQQSYRDHRQSQEDVGQFMQGIIGDLNCWYDILKSQDEKIGDELVNDIKKDVLKLNIT